MGHQATPTSSWTPSPTQPKGRFPFGLVFAVFFVGGVGFAHAKLSHRPLWTVHGIQVSGNRSIGTAELLHRLHLQEGMPWWRVPRHPAAALQAEQPRLRAVSVSFAFPRDLRVAVEERESCLRVLGPPALEVSQDGVLLDPRDALDPADLPLLTGSLPAGFRVGGRCDFPDAPGWTELLALRDNFPELWREVSEIHYSGGADFQVYLRDGRKVILWETDVNRDLKDQLAQILRQLKRQGIGDAVVDLRFRDQAVVRLPESTAADSAQTNTALSPTARPRRAAQATPNRRQHA